MDLGANTGIFTALMAPHFAFVLAPDVDPLAVELHYAALRKGGPVNILPLVMDCSNPSPALGWVCAERESFQARCKVSLITALALVHHLVLTEGIPFAQLASFFHNLLADGGTLLLEFVPKEDSQVQRMTAARPDPLAGYSLEAMRSAFAGLFQEVRQATVEDSQRTLFVYRKNL
jgi:ribosomal protein L11 methylase PrmA